MQVLARLEPQFATVVPFPLTEIDATSTGSAWWAPTLRTTLLVATDLTALMASAILASTCAKLVGLELGPFVLLKFFSLLLLFPFVFGVAELYPGFGLGPVETLRRLITQTTVGSLVAVLTMLIYRNVPLRAYAILAGAWLISLAAVPIARCIALRELRLISWWAEPAIVVTSRSGLRMQKLLGRIEALGYRPVTIVRSEAYAPTERFEESLVDQIVEMASVDSPHSGIGIVLLSDDAKAASPTMIDALQQHFPRVIVVRSSEDIPVEGVTTKNLGGILGLEFRNRLLVRKNRLIKRLIDITVASVALMLALPFMVLAGALVKFFSRGPALYFQYREGLGGDLFKVWKIRSMHVDAEQRLERHLAENPEARAEWDANCKLRNDPRIIPIIGPFIRRFSIDELPQIFQVLTGVMSLVGPRPFPQYHLVKFSSEFRQLRRRVRPGLTGLWQVSSRSDGGLEVQREHDGHYIRNWSIWIDLYILARTSLVVISGRGAC
jgi:Undecaprenyl-phosphate galactose phosphotransferase WbaP